jgi:hypothetical protein
MRKRLLSEPSRLALIYHAPESYVSAERIEALGRLGESLFEEVRVDIEGDARLRVPATLETRRTFAPCSIRRETA